MGKISSCTNIQKQRAIIKFRLKELVNQHYPNGYAVSELRRKLSEPQYGGFEFADNTIKRTLDCSRDNQSLDMCLALALCRLYDVPFDSIFAPHEDIDTSHLLYDNDLRVSPTGVLLDLKYMHTYSGYMYPRNTDSNRLISFSLKIERLNGSSKATMTCHNVVNTENIDKEIIDVFTGIPKVIGDDEKIVFIELKNNKNAFIHFYFEYDHYKSQEMYFRRGAIFTQGTKPKKPILFDFVMFYNLHEDPPIDEIQGLLTLPSNIISIPKIEMVKLIEKDPAIKDFVEEYMDEIREKSVYIIKEDAIISAACGDNKLLEDPRRINEAISCLMRIRKHSSSPRYVVYEDNEKLAKYAKDLAWK